MWNPVKELKVPILSDIHPTKAFHAPVESGEGIERKPVERGTDDAPDRVESGEGIESPAAACGRPEISIVESGEGIESPQRTPLLLSISPHVESGEGIERTSSSFSSSS